MIDWFLEGVEFGNCSCDWCFPCERQSRPGRKNCRGFEVVRIDRGYFGDISLAGLNFAMIYAWPGPMLDGDGEIVPIIDERADPVQRKALATILFGGHTEEAKTHWWVFHAMSKTMHAPIFSAIGFDVDLEAQTARVLIPGMVDAVGRPTSRSAAGLEHGVRIDIPRGIAFEPTGSGAVPGRRPAPIDLDLHGTYGQFNVLRHSGSGVVHRA